ncbi:cbb3-type cytochrome c oxidase subunit I [Niabella insulamsoli]|uniref:cbb3-type cytochrome c oxidase subunit I n=1 Tax=Niabella insulamsoli TaxID=3144874 RepID=UPI0031FBA8CF
MKTNKFFRYGLTLSWISNGAVAEAQEKHNYIKASDAYDLINVAGIAILIACLAVLIYKYLRFQSAMKDYKNPPEPDASDWNNLNADQIEKLTKRKKRNSHLAKVVISFVFLLASAASAFAQDLEQKKDNLFGQPGIIITLVLLAIPLVLAAILIISRASNAIKRTNFQKNIQRTRELARQMMETDDPQLLQRLEERKRALDFKLSNQELSGSLQVADTKGMINNVSDKYGVHFTAVKRKAAPRPALEPGVTKLVLWYLGCAAFWLLLGTAIGEYVGIKFVVPDADHVSWLSFGRLRPVHTNMVFWGWASLGIMGLGYYVVPVVSNTKLYSIKWGWIALILTNLQVTIGTISLLAGINNGGGEFREYIFPIMALFAVALILTVINYLLTVAKRTTKEIYISNWYIIGALIFTIIIALTAYLPFWQNGLGETITQGYYMHSGVGMWFTLFTLGLLYYFIPQQINKPIYAYSLGILAFWTQILFYTIIGTHHFVFSAIPWWLQTVAIVGSAGMIIPVVAATINFGMTFKGHWNKVSNSYTLPFFLTAVIYYFIVSLQGTAEAFRFTNLLWHFTDFTVAHSHLGFYGIISFAIWGGSYAIVPRLTGKEPPQHLVGAHFWLAFIGLLLYAVPLMIGGTIRGVMWMEHQPFIESVVVMFEYWVWRAVGGSLMFISHIIYFYNFYRMVIRPAEETDAKQQAIAQLEHEITAGANASM